MDLIKTNTPRKQVEFLVGLPWNYIVKQLAYHALQEDLQRRRLQYPVSPKLVAQIESRFSDAYINSVAEQRAIDALYAPKVQVPEYLARLAERRKKYG